MSSVAGIDGDALIGLLGLDTEAPAAQETLARLARGMQPELDPDDAQSLIDWVTLNELGLEFGFEDAAYVGALDPDLRRKGRLLLSQVYFYGDTPKTMPFAGRLPFGLAFADDRQAVRAKLAAYEAARRSYLHDAWTLPAFDMTVAYAVERGTLESVYCHLPYRPWPETPEHLALLAPFEPEAFVPWFGKRWHDESLRERFAPLGFDDLLADVRLHHEAPMRMTHGLELGFTKSGKLPSADPRYPESLAFASVNFYSSRLLDAREWPGRLPCGLAFDDSQTDLVGKVGKPPAEKKDGLQHGVAIWHFDDFSLSVMYSNIENRVLRVTMMAPGYWAASGAGHG